MKLFHLGAIAKQRLKQWMARKWNARYSHYHGYKFFTDAACYVDLKDVERPVIFDVGANVGQTAVSFVDWFPHGQVHCFEPSPPSFAVLSKNLAGTPAICHQLALSDQPGRVKVRLLSDDPDCTINSLANTADTAEDEANSVWFEVDTLPAFAARHGISDVHILKIDTEGRDLQILQGSESMLSSGSIHNIVVEANLIARTDTDHIQLRDFISYLEPFGFELFSLFDVMHDRDGSVAFMNALFKKRTPRPTA
jgi:FkbM family methyltransferase